MLADPCSWTLDFVRARQFAQTEGTRAHDGGVKGVDMGTALLAGG